MNNQDIMKEYIKIDVPLDEIRKKIKFETQELNTVIGKEEDTRKQLNTSKMIYMFLTILMVVFLILSVNLKLK